MRALGLALLTAGLAACGAPEPPARKPNVVLVVIDTLRPDHLGFGGYTRETAPFLAGLAAEGTVFERAFSTSSWTAPSTASIFTGLYPPRHGVVQGFFAHFHGAQEEGLSEPQVLDLIGLPREYPTLPELFQAEGYRTFGLTTNINIGAELGFDRGFERFERLDNVPAKQVLERLGGWKTELAAESDSPFLLYLHFNDVHSPYHPRKRWFVDSDDERERRMSAYDSEISYLDSFLAELARDYSLGPDTLFVVASDHGEEFLDHGAWFHGFSLHRELNQVLLMVHGPELGVPARRVPINVSLVDVLPTLAELAHLGEDAQREAARNGRSLVPLLGDEASLERSLAQLDERPVYAHRMLKTEQGDLHTWAVMRGGWKLMERDGARSLFDLRLDRGELQDVAAAHPQVVAELGVLLDALISRGVDVHDAGTSIDLDPELLGRLRSLGYAE